MAQAVGRSGGRSSDGRRDSRRHSTRDRVQSDIEARQKLLAEAEAMRLLSAPPVDTTPVDTTPTPEATKPAEEVLPGNAKPNLSVIWLPLDQIYINPKYDRSRPDAEADRELDASVAQHGVVQPVLVRTYHGAQKKKTHELIAGHRRVHSALRNGLPHAPAVVRPLDDVEAADLNATENLQRKDPNPIDIGRSLTNLKEAMGQSLEEWLGGLSRTERRNAEKKEVTWQDLAGERRTPDWLKTVLKRADEDGRQPRITWDDVADKVGRGRRSIHFMVRIAELPEDIQDDIASGNLSPYKARAVITLDNPAQQRALRTQIINENLSFEDATQRAREISGSKQNGSNQSSGTRQNKGSEQKDAEQKAESWNYPSARMKLLADDAERSSRLEALAGVIESLSNARVGQNEADSILHNLSRLRTVLQKEEEQLQAIEQLLQASG